MKKPLNDKDKRKNIYRRAFCHVVRCYVDFKCFSVHRLLKHGAKACGVDFTSDIDMLLRDDQKLFDQFGEACREYYDAGDTDGLMHKRFDGISGRLGKLFLQRKIATERGVTYFSPKGVQARRDKEFQEYHALLSDVRALEEERTNAS